MKTLHERVAEIMARSVSAGTLNSYDQILARLRARWPTEEELIQVVRHFEQETQRISGQPNWRFLDD